MNDGALVSMSGRPALRFERDLRYPIERVWRAVSVPAELEQWFAGAALWTPEVGESFEAAGMLGMVLEVDRPHRLAWDFNGERQSFDLVETGDGCRLTFCHELANQAMAAQTATGWHTYLSRLEPYLAGEPITEERAHEGWAELHERYAVSFGVDPAPGRRFAEALREQG